MTDAALAKRLGKRIVELRRQRQITAEKLAYENDVSKGYLSDVENGKKLPSLSFLNMLAKALSVQLKELFE
jgi:transcriptional regulator with XRE-family HTH domain